MHGSTTRAYHSQDYRVMMRNDVAGQCNVRCDAMHTPIVQSIAFIPRGDLGRVCRQYTWPASRRLHFFSSSHTVVHWSIDPSICQYSSSLHTYLHTYIPVVPPLTTYKSLSDCAACPPTCADRPHCPSPEIHVRFGHGGNLVTAN